MESQVSNHYHRGQLVQTIAEALEKAGKNLDHLTTRDLSSIDQLHTGGVKASLDLINSAGIRPGDHVLDAGCGIGGTARLLVEKTGCRVTGVDLAESFIDTALFLTRASGFDDRIDYHCGSILDMPFENHTFDSIISQHMLMNIADKKQAAREFYRVLKPGGKLLLHEITQGDKNKVYYPVPWAENPDISFLDPWPVMADVFKTEAFSIISESDNSQIASKWWERVKKAATNPPAKGLGPKLIFGQKAGDFGKNMHTSFLMDGIRLVEAVLKKK